MKKNFTTPELNLLKVHVADVICTSDPQQNVPAVKALTMQEQSADEDIW